VSMLKMALRMPLRFAAAAPAVRVTFDGTTSTLTLSIAANEELYVSGDGEGVETGQRDLVKALETALRTHAGTGAASIACSLSAEGIVTVTAPTAITLLWGDGATTLDPTLLGWPATNTSSATSHTAPAQARGQWLPGQPVLFDSGDLPGLVGVVVPTQGGLARASLLEDVLYSRELAWDYMPADRVQLADAPADRPYGVLEHAWVQALGRGAPVRVYDDASAHATTDYTTYRLTEPRTRPYRRMDRESIRLFEARLALLRVE